MTETTHRKLRTMEEAHDFYKQQTDAFENQGQLINQYVPQMEAYTKKMCRKRRAFTGQLSEFDFAQKMDPVFELTLRVLQDRISNQNEDNKAKEYALLDERDAKKIELDKKRAVNAQLAKANEALEKRIERRNEESEQAKQYIQKLKEMQTEIIQAHPIPLPDLGF